MLLYKYLITPYPIHVAVHPLWTDQQQVLLQDIEEHVVPKQPRTWDSVVRAIRRMGLEDFADQLSGKEPARIM